jgi:hypothetical protein
LILTFKVTEKLKILLNDCSPNASMLCIKELKKLSLNTKYTIHDKCSQAYHLYFEEIEDRSWCYTEAFYDELIKNEIRNNFLSLE